MCWVLSTSVALLFPRYPRDRLSISSSGSKLLAIHASRHSICVCAATSFLEIATCPGDWFTESARMECSIYTLLSMVVRLGERAFDFEIIYTNIQTKRETTVWRRLESSMLVLGQRSDIWLHGPSSSTH